MEPVTRVAVRVSFLRSDQPPSRPPRSFPEGAQVVTLSAPSVTYYRYLYDTVGADYLWWLRRVTPDADLAHYLRTPGISVHVLYVGGEPAGFYELDARPWPVVNLSYFGLMPGFIGRGFGGPFLRHAVDLVWRHQARTMTLNTCTADHPRALPGYLAAGFSVYREIEEVWDVPRRLGMKIPPHLPIKG
jgi:GNAT superfamily N-acetyltransferase